MDRSRTTTGDNSGFRVKMLGTRHAFQHRPDPYAVARHRYSYAVTATSPHPKPDASQTSTATRPGAAGYPGLFVALEGGDGAGKSTQIKRLAKALHHTTREILLTREPGGSDLGDQLRSLVLDPQMAVDPRTEALLFAASRSAHVQTVIRPALERGAIVITDRYVDSSVAYQGAGRELGIAAIRELNDWAVDGVLPDLTVLLDVAEQTGRQRRDQRHEDRMERESAQFHNRVRQTFMALAQEDPTRYLVLAADEPMSVISAHIHHRVLALLDERGLA